MSIFHTQDISEKPSSYTHGFAVKEINYQALKNEVRNSVIDKYSQFEKLGQSPSFKNDLQKGSPRQFTNTVRTIDLLFGKQPEKNEPVSQSSPAKISGLKKKMQQMGSQKEQQGFKLGSGTKDFRNQFFEQKNSNLFLQSPQLRIQTQENKPFRSESLTFKLESQKQQQSVTMKRLVEIQNLLDMTSVSELQQMPKSYLDELHRVASAINRSLRHHNDIQVKI